MLSPRHRSSAVPLSAAWVVLVVYASLYPFEGWQWPAGSSPLDLLRLPWPPYRQTFDLWSNFAGYLPLGFLLTVAVVRSGGRLATGWWLGLLGPALLSYVMEGVQHLIPGRYPSLLDWVLNAGGAAAGACLAVAGLRLSLIDLWQAARDRWVIRRSRGALVLLILWPLGLLFPTPFPLGVGLGWERVQDALVGWLLDVPWAQEALELISDVPAPLERPAIVVSGLGIVLGLLGPGLLAFSVMHPGWRRWVVVLLLAAAGWGASTLSAVLNFGPLHALGWVSPEVWPALEIGGLALLALTLVGQRMAAALGVVALSSLMILVAQVPADPYYATSLQAWEQGQFIRFHGLAQWIGWFWPGAATAWLLLRLADRG